jgi:hypothetical protein
MSGKRDYWLLAASLLWIGTVLPGCGGSSPLAGTVVRDGQPVSSGTIRFVPDIDQGNDGPTVTMVIEGGQFSNVAISGQGSLSPGPNRVSISVPKAGTNPEEPEMEEYEFDVSVPEGGTQDMAFDLAQGRRKQGDDMSDGLREP